MRVLAIVPVVLGLDFRLAVYRGLSMGRRARGPPIGGPPDSRDHNDMCLMVVPEVMVMSHSVLRGNTGMWMVLVAREGSAMGRTFGVARDA